MTIIDTKMRELIEGRPALIVIDIQAGTFVKKEVRSIPHMPDYETRMLKARIAIDKRGRVTFQLFLSKKFIEQTLLISDVSWTETRMFIVLIIIPILKSLLAKRALKQTTT